MSEAARAGAVFSLVLVLASATVGEAFGQERVRQAHRTVPVMGTVFNIDTWAASQREAGQAIDAVVREMGRVEAFLSSWRDDSEVGVLNVAAVGAAVAVSTELAGLLADVGTWTEITGGAFHPAVGALVDAWDLRGAGRRPTPSELAAALEATGSLGMRIDPDAGTVTRLSAAAWMDPGGFGKGAALRSAGDTLRALGVTRARLDLGGQLLLMGGESATIGVAHPARRGEVAARLRLADVSVATSGQSERGVEVDGARFGHIIDPRTGQPAPAWGSVTVVSTDPVVADVLATALFVLGPVQGMDVARELADVGVLFLADTDDGLVSTHNSAMSRWLAQP